MQHCTGQINIFLEENEKKKQQLLKIAKENWKPFFPKELEHFYNIMNKHIHKKIDLNKHINKYYRKNHEVIAWFPYSSDNFLLHYSYDSNKIILFGNKMNLHRILMDFITVGSTYLPLHSSCLQKGNKAIGLIGESGGGKTSLLLKLLQEGYSFIADDSLFATKESIFPVSDLISIRTKFPNNDKLEKILKGNKNEKVFIHIEKIAKLAQPSFLKNCSNIQFFFLQSKESKWKSLKELLEPFPCIAHHSFWCLHFFVQENQEQWIEEKIAKSFEFWEEKTKNIIPITIDFSDFDNYVQNFVKKYSKVG